MSSPSKAAIIPLQYDNRVEDSIVYLSHTWSELEKLLIDPVHFFAGHELLYNQMPGDYRLWKLVAPVSVALIPAHDNYTAGLQMLAAQHEFKPEKDGNLLSADWVGSQLKEEFSDGGFLAQFAIGTRMLTIRYFCPPTSSRRFNGQLEPPTLALASGTSHGSAHFDIGASEFDRAAFVVDYIEDRTWLATQLQNDARLRFKTADMMEPGQLLRRDMSGGNLPAGESISGDGPYPMVFIEGASWTIPGGCVCAMCCIIKHGPKHILTCLDMKWYDKCPCKPGMPCP